MDKRFAIFLVTTVLMWTGFIALQVYFAPERPPEQVAKKEGLDPEEAKQDVAEDKAKAGGAAGEREKEKDGQQPAEVPAPAAVAVDEHPRQLIAIGSLDPASPYRLLVTLDSRGASLQRAELTSPQFRSVEDSSGYLGHLALADGKHGGAEVHVVGPGTPAALAQSADGKTGLAVGDLIEQVDGQAVTDSAGLEAYLRTKTRPGQTVSLAVTRPGVQKPVALKAVLIRRPVEIVAPESHTFQTPDGKLRLLPEDPPSLLMTLENVGGRILKSAEEEIAGLPSLQRGTWKVEQQGPDFVEFSLALNEAILTKINKPGSLKVVKRYTLAKANGEHDAAYHLDLKVSIQNQGVEPQALAYRLDGPTGLPLEGWWYSTKLSPNWSGAGARDVAWEQTGLGHMLLGCPKIVSDTKAALKAGKPTTIDLLEGDQAASLEYVGVDTQFFAGVLLPQPIAEGQPIKFRSAAAMAVQDVTEIPKTRLRTANVSFRLTTSPTTVQPGGALEHTYRVFLGPKQPGLLSQYGLDRLIEYGWKIFGYPAMLLLWVLNALYQITALVGIPNYGIAIILLTVIVRSCMIPVSLKQARSAAKMQELAPEIQKIKDKFPDDPMKQHAAVQELYKKHDFNMFSGCLPVFIQLPIFIGLYRCLSVDIDLRDASLIPGISWASNLAGPDKLFYWKDWVFAMIGDEADGWLGPYFNVFPLITVALFLVQQKMFTPPATDEQTKMQQQMMTYMTVFMGVMFYKVPAGLCIYFITSSLWGICERKLLPKAQPKESASGPSAGIAATAGFNGSAKIAGTKRQKQKR